MYDIAQEFKRWFTCEPDEDDHEHEYDPENKNWNLFKMVAFNYRTIDHNHCIYSIFQPRDTVAQLAILPTRMLKEFNDNLGVGPYEYKIFPRPNFRRLYINHFKL